MGNQCCSANNTTVDQANIPTPFNKNIEVEEEQGQTTQAIEKNQPAVHAQIAEIQEQITEQKQEEDENKQEVSEYVFKRQLESLKLAIEKADNLKNIAKNGQLLTAAIAQVETVIQFLSQTMSIPNYISQFKTELIGLYGDLQNFRAFHLRYTMNNAFFTCLSHLTDLANFFRDVFSQHIKDSKYDYKAIFEGLYNGAHHDVFENLKSKFELVRDQYNTIAGQNFSTLPNYLYITFSEKKGFKLWNELFPHDFETSNKHFSEKYAEHCSVSTEQILQIISLLDNSNDQRVDIYQWISFVEDYASYLDEEGRISPSEVNSFSQEIQNKTRAMKIAPKKNDEGVYVFQSGMKYTGDLDDSNRRQGQGKLEDEDYEFEGEFVNDLPHGQGREIRKKVVYQGNFKNGLYDGYGTLTFPNGRVYKGNFQAHQFHGQGELVGDEGIKYAGEWKHGSLEVGKITYHDGSYYQGKLYSSFFKDGKGTLLVVKPNFSNAPAAASDKFVEYIDGQWERDAPKYGKISNLIEQSTQYEGEMSNWSISGKGKRFYTDGTYDGELLRDKKNKDGTLIYKNGDKYTGQWLEDYQTKGIYSYSKEKDHYYDGEWSNGVMEGQGKFSYTTGGVYIGKVKDGKRHGKGTYKYANGNVYEGDWYDNNQHGEGKFTYATVSPTEGGDIYSGQFNKGKFHGFGHYYYKKSGKQYVGFWEEDKWCGEGKFFTADHTILKAGVWKNDKLESQLEEKDIIVPQNLKHLILNINHQAAPAPAAH